MGKFEDVKRFYGWFSWRS